MKILSLNYGFIQHFDFPAERVYEWCTDYSPEDLQLMRENGRRSIHRISKDLVLLCDTFLNGRKKIIKQKLVRLYPARCSWTNTHLSGPNKHSQFLYEIVKDSNNSCHLRFTGSQIEYARERKGSKRATVKSAAQLRREDSGAWKLLAKAMKSDLS